MLFFGVFLRESAPTAAKNRTNLGHRRSCRKPLDRSGPNLTHVCRFIWDWTSGKTIKLSSPKGYLEGVRGSHIHKMWEICQTAEPIGTKFGMHIHLGMDMS